MRTSYELSSNSTNQRSIDYALLLGWVITLVLVLMDTVYNKFSVVTLRFFDVFTAVVYLAFLAEWIVRLNRYRNSLKEYVKFNKVEILYFVLGAVCITLAIVNPSLFYLKYVIILKAPNVLGRFNDEKVFEVVVSIFLVAMIVFFVFPFLNVIAVSISSPSRVVNIIPKDIDLFAFRYVFADKGFYRALLNSVFITAIGTVVSVIIMALAAYPLSIRQMPLKGPVMIFFFIVMLFSGGMAPNMLLMSALGLTNTIWALIIPLVVNVFHLLLLKGFFESLPEELAESAKLDGASNYRILFSIIVPVSVPMIATVTLFTAIIYWNNINNSILYITYKTVLYPLPMYIRNFLNRNPSDIALSQPELLEYWDTLKMAYILASIVPIAMLYPLILKYFTKGVAVGSVKG